jgi:opacity protein-like surface antigen
MKRFSVFGAALGLALVAGPVVAQMNSIPVYHNPKGGSGLLLAADFGKGMNDESGKNTAWAFRTSFGIGPFSFGGSIGTVNPVIDVEPQSEIQYMGNMGLRLLGGGLLPVSLSLQVGVGVLNIDGSAVGDVDLKIISVPIGLGLGFNVPAPTFNFEPWVATRLQYTRNEIDIFNANQVGWGVSAGMDFSFLMGLGIHIAGDWEMNPLEAFEGAAGAAIPKTTPFVFGIGLNYRISIPGLPGVPMVPGI